MDIKIISTSKPGNKTSKEEFNEFKIVSKFLDGANSLLYGYSRLFL